MKSSKCIHEKAEGLDVWQRGFHDHVIRNQSDYDDVYRYIENNSVQWEQDDLYTT